MVEHIPAFVIGAMVGGGVAFVALAIVIVGGDGR